MKTFCSKRVRDYGRPSDSFWKHPTIDTLHDVTLKHDDGRTMADITVRGAGHPYTGVEWIQPYDENENMVFMRGDEADFKCLGQDPSQRFFNYASWDCREWQMWRGRTYRREQRPRWVPASCDAHVGDERLLIWCEYEVDGVRTHQDWIFGDQVDDHCLQYDCLTTVKNISGRQLLDYSQFFASYTKVNGRNGAYFWGRGGELVLSWDAGIEHLDKFIVARASPIDRLGRLPHFPRTPGMVGGHWHRPVLVGQATTNMWRHVVMVEQEYAAAITLGMTGVAMDYVLYPGRLEFEPGEAFTCHIRHLLLRSPNLPRPGLLDELFCKFEQDHEPVRNCQF